MQSKQGALKESKLLVNVGITLGNIPATAPGAPNSWTFIGVSLKERQLPRCLGPGAATFPCSSAQHVTSLSQWPPYQSPVGQLGVTMCPQDIELEEYPKAPANAGPWQVQPGVRRGS